MISLNDIRTLEPALQGLDDKALQDIRVQLYALAQLALDVYADTQAVSKNPPGTVTSELSNSKIPT